MKKTVAIVGSHTRTRFEVPWKDKDIDIWVFNESASIGWPKRVDGVFQMHAEPVWKNPMNRNDPKYPQWMKQDHPYPIWMLDEYSEVPASESYPINDISDNNALGKLYKDGKRREFYTSSVAYAIALAIQLDYKCIKMFGIEMESETEYRYQGEGVFYWLGVARGRGVDVYISKKSRMFIEPLYGYEGGAYLGREQLLKRQVILEKNAKEVEKQLDKANQVQQATMEKAMNESGGEPGLAEVATTKQYFQNLKAQEQAVYDNGMFIGARTEIVRYLEKCDQMDKETGEHLLARQEFEITAAGAGKGKVKIQEKVKVLGAEARIAWRNIEEGIEGNGGQQKLTKLSETYHKAHQKYLEGVFELGRITGVVQENMVLLDTVDQLVKAAGGVKSEEALLAEKMTDKLKAKVNDGRLTVSA